MGSFPSILANGLRAAGDLIYPPHCRGCAVPLDADEPTRHLCATCAQTLDREINAPYCPTCAAQVGPYELRNDRCRDCRDGQSNIVATVRLGRYHGLIGELTRAYKYDGREEIGPMLAERLIARLKSVAWRHDLEAVAVVPTHWRHRLGRPLYAPEQLGKAIERAINVPCLPLLRRTRAGRHQVGLTFAARAENVRGAFALMRGAKISGAKLLLVDDVKTTGATLNECAKVLRRAGANTVHAAVIAKVSTDGNIFHNPLLG